MDVMISTVGMCLGGRAKLKPSKSRGLGLCEFLGGWVLYPLVCRGRMCCLLNLSKRVR